MLRGGASLLQGLAQGWQLRVAGSAQWTDTPLVASEQIGLAGSTAVRGFHERAVAADSGVVINAEVYTPDVSGRVGLPGNLRGLAFVDAGHGANRRTGGSLLPGRTTVASTGIGARYGFGRDVSVRLDVARVADAGASFTEKRGDWRAHLSAMLAF